jgi:hypothetical protein
MVIATALMSATTTNLQESQRYTVVTAASRPRWFEGTVREPSAERHLVSKVWARDWDCPEDAAYDDM